LVADFELSYVYVFFPVDLENEGIKSNDICNGLKRAHYKKVTVPHVRGEVSAISRIPAIPWKCFLTCHPQGRSNWEQNPNRTWIG